MPPFQTAMLLNPLVAIEGMWADNGAHDVLSYIGANSVIAPGRALVFHAGDADNQCRLPATTGEAAVCIGVSLYQAAWPNNPYAINDPIPVVKSGRLWVTVEEAVDPTSIVFVRFTAGTGNQTVGRFRASADTGKAVACPGLRYLTTQATIDGLVELGIDLPL